jgi:hypothetical protein
MEHEEPPSPRQTCLPYILLSMLVLFGLPVMIIATGGWFLHLMMLVCAVVGFGLLHYLLWGRLLTQQTAGQREEEAFRDKTDLDDWWRPESDRFTRF